MIETVDENSILQGGHGNSGINADDIIPPFTDGADGSYPGNNYSVDAVWSGHGANTSFTATVTGEAILAADCNYNRTPTTTSTTVYDATTNAPWGGTETVGASAYDTATVGPELVAGPRASEEVPPVTGTVTYTFYTNGTCAGDGTSETVTLNSNGVPNSSPTISLGAGNYSYEDMYNGDANYAPSTGECESFSVGQAPTSTATVLDDAATTGQPWTGNETTGAKAYDTSTVSGGIEGFTPTGTVTYTLFDNGNCTAPSQVELRAHAIISTQQVTLSDGTVPNSATTSALTPGNYSFDASYGGDTNYEASMASPCEPFSVADGPTTTATVLKDAANGQNWAGTETTGAAAYDTSTVSGEAGGIVPTGTVTYSYFTNDTCHGTPTSTQNVPLNADGTVPNSATTASLAAGSYSFDAAYGGDDNYSASAVSSCEPFTVAAVTAAPSTSASTATPAATPTAGTTTTPPATQGATAIAFTGADIAEMGTAAVALLGLGGLLVLTSRRRRGRASQAE